MTEDTDRSEHAIAAADALGLAYRVTRHGPVRSLEEAAAARGVPPAAVVKTIVVRLADDDYRFVLVPGDREIAWPKLRALLGVNRLSMPDAETARQVTGYVRGTITPLGSTTEWPVFADERIAGKRVSMGAGEHGYSLFVQAEPDCPADLFPSNAPDGQLNFFDLSAYLGLFNAQDPAADFFPDGGDGQFNFFDVSAYLAAYNAGCP